MSESIGTSRCGAPPLVSSLTALCFEGHIGGRWLVLAIQRLGDPPATISHNYRDKRDVYVTQVFADHATLSKLPPGIDLTQGGTRVVIDASQVADAEVFKRLGIGESVELMLKPDKAPQARRCRYRCITLDDSIRGTAH